LIAIALGAGLLAFFLSRSIIQSKGAADRPDHYCYTLRTAWVCANALSECRTRLANELPADILSPCQPRRDDVRGRDDDILTP
jgi:hypothetical protein